ncbi:MAG: 4-hydroxybenzoate octaprenyltransferase [Proteobacteria bacterium]|jgi:4-hydroxybenzoate polyprenyltransferase|nr:4-hydroxybenzoate octaprenyltransferase [Pseudomonadota bacterium]MDA1011077.1 4-hydroxybenzoate octaprenyltransferase [Pseudomonadota bacterium]
MLNSLQLRLSSYARLIRMDKPIGACLLLWPTLWAIWMSSGGAPNAHIFWVFVMGTFLMRSAGCAINDYADRDYDPHVKRTANRPLATKEIAPWEALVVATLLALIAFGLVLTLNALTIKLSFIALLLAISYPFAKRFISMPQAYLGVTFGVGIPMAWASAVDHVPFVAYVTMLANVFWVLAYDTEYAMVDRDDDMGIGIKTSAILFGKYDVAMVLAFQTTFLFLLLAVGIMSALGFFYYMGLAGAAVSIAFQYPMIKYREREGCFRAFRHNNLAGGMIFFGLLLDKAFVGS